MTALSDLPDELVNDIIGRIPITSLSSFRSTCENWDELTETRILGKAPSARKQFCGFVQTGGSVCSMRFNLEGIKNKDGDGDLIDSSVKKVSEFDHLDVRQIFYCEGLVLLCVRESTGREKHLVWNPYLGLTKWIEPNSPLDNACIYAFGFDKKANCHKILNEAREFQIYDFSSSSWRILDNVRSKYEISSKQGGVTVKGNAYFLAVKRTYFSLLCFDFTRERFGPGLKMPVYVDEESIEILTLSCVRDEQLAALHQRYDKLEVWITTKIEPKAVSWIKFLEVDLISINCLPVDNSGGSFFVDEEKRVAVVFGLRRHECIETNLYHKACVFGEHGYFKTVSLGEVRYRALIDCFAPYVPSLVQLPKKRKRVNRR